MKDLIFLFKGDLVTSKRPRPYLVKVTEEEYNSMRHFPYPEKFRGVVIASNNRDVPAAPSSAPYTRLFVNPYHEMHTYGWPCFVRVNAEDVNTEKWFSSLGVSLD